MTDLTLICESCRFPIEGDTGSVYVRLADIGKHAAAEREWKEHHPAGTAVDIAELMLHPDGIHWRTGHDRCRDDHNEGCYEIDAPTISAWPQLARWTAHLMEKNWFGDSDWGALLRELSGERPARRIRVAAREAA